VAWQDNLFSNLLVLFIILALFVIIYCKVAGKSLLDVIKDIRGGFSSE